jgi:hypothetical protein
MNCECESLDIDKMLVASATELAKNLKLTPLRLYLKNANTSLSFYAC